MQSRIDGPPTSSAPIHLLLVGENEQDFSYLSDLLRQTGDGHLGLDHARSPEEAVARLGQTPYDLLLCEYKSGDGTALRLPEGRCRPAGDLSQRPHERDRC